ncbi:3976_t:CDS:2, partial [Gigaspora margarita]
FDGIPFDTNLQFKIINGKKPECTHAPEFYINETNRDDDDIKNQILEAYKIKPEPVVPKNPKDYYSNKLINKNPIISKLKS